MSRLNVANFRHPDGTADNINLTSTGRVGIGTSSPERTFQVVDSSNAFLSAKCGSVEGFVNVTSSAVNLESSSSIPVTFSPGGILRGRFDTSGNLQFNSGYGSVATAYGVRAWCNADLTGSGSIRGSGNVSSLGDQGTGRWQFHFGTAMPDTNYAAVGMQKPNADVVNITGIHPGTPGPGATWDTYTTGTVAFVYSNASGVLIDPLIGNVVVLR